MTAAASTGSPGSAGSPERLDGSSGLGAALHQVLAQAQRRWHAPGVSAGLVRDGRLVWSDHVGVARVDGAVPADDDTQFMIGSVTKTFTALLILELRDEGRLSLDDPVGRFVPDTRHSRIPLRQLLSHTSGLQREPVGRIWESLEAPDRAAMLRGLEDAEQVLPAHLVFHYSNLAYAILGEVVEVVAESPWDVLVRERITGPLGMTRTGLVPEADHAIGYHVDPFAGTAVAEPLYVPNATAPLGGLWSTVADLTRYAAFVAEPDERVLRPETVEEMCRPVVILDPQTWTRAHGLGFSMSRRGERVFVGHGGAMPGFLTGLSVSRPERTGVVVFASCTAGADPSALAAQLLELAVQDRPFVAPAWVPEQPVAGVTDLLGTWWSEGDAWHLFVRDGQLWARQDDDPRTHTRFEQLDADLFRAVEGRERGELLEVERSPNGHISRMYFATYAVTRDPLGFAALT